jgi:hypothetical protein
MSVLNRINSVRAARHQKPASFLGIISDPARAAEAGARRPRTTAADKAIFGFLKEPLSRA